MFKQSFGIDFLRDLAKAHLAHLGCATVVSVITGIHHRLTKLIMPFTKLILAA